MRDDQPITSTRAVQLQARRESLLAQRAELAALALAEGSKRAADRDSALKQFDDLVAMIDRMLVPKVRAARSKHRPAQRRDPIVKMFEVARVPKTERAEVRVAIDARKPQRKVDVRLWFVPKGEVAMVPSRKGVTLDAAELGALIEALRLAEQHLGGGS